MVEELSEDQHKKVRTNSIKKTQLEIKGPLIEIKNNVQRSNSRVEETENPIKDCFSLIIIIFIVVEV